MIHGLEVFVFLLFAYLFSYHYFIYSETGKWIFAIWKLSKSELFNSLFPWSIKWRNIPNCSYRKKDMWEFAYCCLLNTMHTSNRICTLRNISWLSGDYYLAFFCINQFHDGPEFSTKDLLQFTTKLGVP